MHQSIIAKRETDHILEEIVKSQNYEH